MSDARGITGAGRYRPARVGWLVGSCVVLSAGVALLLGSRLGSDGWSTMLNGFYLRTGLPFVVVSLAMSVLFIGIGWARGLRPDLGTLVQPVVVGTAIGAFLPLAPRPEATGMRWLEFAVGFLVICVGVAGYLAADLGIGPTEAPSIAWDPPIPFRWSYMAVQALGCLLGFACGADVGLGTLLVVFGIGPLVDRLRVVMPHWESVVGGAS